MAGLKESAPGLDHLSRAVSQYHAWDTVDTCMATPKPQLAKLSRPRLHDAVARDRLFHLLDEKRNHPVVWISGPPGSGKTTLAGSYLEVSAAPATWYLLDRGDADPATFFYYLGQAVGASPGFSGRALPSLTQEYLSDLEGFARRFLRDAFARLPQGSLLVFDNYHEIAPASPLHAMLNAACPEIPEGGNILVISRAQPPAVFSRARVSGTLETLEWEDLRLTADETAAVVARRGKLDPTAVTAIHAQSGGWVAGVRLLLERGHADTSVTLARPEALESAFDYFASEIFDSAPESLQRFLLRTAFLPRFTAAMAASVSGDAQAGRRVQELFKRRLFVDRRLGKEITYQYHDLFRAFLQNRAAEQLSREELGALTEESARLLLGADMVDDAFGLFVQAQAWESAERILLDQANTLITSGRWRTLENWTETLPPGRLVANPWLRYWLGRSKALVDAVEAFRVLELAYEAFTADRNSHGQLLCAATAVEALHFAVVKWEAMGLWLERLKQALDRSGGPLSLDDELRVHATLFWACENSTPDLEVIARSKAIVEELLPRCNDANLRVSVANILHYHACRALDARATRIARQAARPILDSADLSADRRALYYLAEGLAHFEFCRFADALDCYDKADVIIEVNALPGRAHIAGVWRAHCQCRAGDIERAYATLRHTEQLEARDYSVINLVLESTRASIRFERNEIESAVQHARAAIEISEKWGPRVILGFLLPRLAYMLIAAQRAPEAREHLRQLKLEPLLTDFQCANASIALLEAWDTFLCGGHGYVEALRNSLVLARAEGERLRMCWYPRALMDLLPIALVREIEPDTVQAIIALLRLSPPPSAPEAWPWPLKIHTLGRFEVLLDGGPLEFGRKAPKRTIALLKALIALGGADVPEQKLADALWPDLEGDAALESLAAALHRLRRLLGGNEAIRQSSGLLSLNRQRCFVDAWAFEGALDRNGEDASALHLYRGSFLPGDGDAPWSASMRERLRGRFVRAVVSVGQELEAAGKFEEAIRLYTRGTETDDLVEAFYRGLMRCYHRLDRLGEAASTFRHLRQTLSVTLGARPSAESQQLFQELQLE
jgi:DNA-binding SARP family transcriptional activator